MIGLVRRLASGFGGTRLGHLQVQEYNPDIIFILDKPKVSQDFVDAVNVPVVYIDHHDVQNLKGVHYYNPRKWDKDDARCVTYWCYQITKQNLWIATVGSISDWQVPDYLKDFKKEYKGFIGNEKEPNDILFETRLGELCRIFSFLLKGDIRDVKKRVSMLLKIENPNEILDRETEHGKFLFDEAKEVGKKYDNLLKLALAVKPTGKLYVFTYPSSKLSLTSDLSNELLHRFPDKIILIAREKDGSYRISFRSKGIILPPILKKALEGIQGYGGGHEYACGGNILVKDFDKFVENLEKQIDKK